MTVTVLVHVHMDKQRVCSRRLKVGVFQCNDLMKVTIKHWHAVAQWRWDTGKSEPNSDDSEGDVCGICRVPFEGCCPTCKMPGDDCPLSECVTSCGNADGLIGCQQFGENVPIYFTCIASSNG